MSANKALSYLCEANFNLDEGLWYDLTYVTYVGTPAELDGCEFVGIQAAAVPTNH
jgi:hypothetical protein